MSLGEHRKPDYSVASQSEYDGLLESGTLYFNKEGLLVGSSVFHKGITYEQPTEIQLEFPFDHESILKSERYKKRADQDIQIWMEESAEYRDRFMSLRWEDEDMEDEFFKIAQKLIENPYLLEKTNVKIDEESKKEILSSGILREYYEVIRLYRQENEQELSMERIEMIAQELQNEIENDAKNKKEFDENWQEMEAEGVVRVGNSHRFICDLAVEDEREKEWEENAKRNAAE